MKPYYAFLALCAVLAMVLTTTGAQDLNLFDDDNFDDDQDIQNIEKKYARLSYFRAPTRPRYGWRGRGRGRFSSRPKMPWEYLPEGSCFRRKCRTSYDCCRRHSLCNPAAKICYDCWYGHPCRKNADCCARYPTCNKARGMCVDERMKR